jgi:predicted NUDIX family NTP pyrophosphohydrolase
MYRRRGTKLEVRLVHPGGPFWQNKDKGAWSIPKGELAEGDDLLDAAKREFAEETGFTPTGQFMPLKPVKQKSGKVVHAWAVEGDLDTSSIKSNSFTMEWPPKSAELAEFPEVDRAEFFDLEKAKTRINPAQAACVTELERLADQSGDRHEI